MTQINIIAYKQYSAVLTFDGTTLPHTQRLRFHFKLA